jgi:hypothetical protein
MSIRKGRIKKWQRHHRYPFFARWILDRCLHDGRRLGLHYFVDDLSPEYRPDGSTGHREGIKLQGQQRLPF